MNVTTDSGEVARYTRRVVVMEEPEIAERLAEMARENGHSLAAEIRHAVRYWLTAWEEHTT